MKRNTQIVKQIPDFLTHLELLLRSGYSVTQSLEIMAKDLSAPMADEVKEVLKDVAGGADLMAALDAFVERAPSNDLELVVATLKVQKRGAGEFGRQV